MIVCICHRVSDRDIARAAREGCGSFDALQFELSVATSCGKCGDCARETFERCTAQAAGAALWSERVGAPSRGPVIPLAIVPARRDLAPAAA